MNTNDVKNILNFKPKANNVDLEYLDPHEVTTKILSFLSNQSLISEKQFKTSKYLIISTIIIMIFQIGYAIWFNNKSNHKQSSLTKIIEIQSKQSETISRMSLNLLDLQNQVSILEKEKIKLLKK